jgi:hypothetical protein
VHKDVTVLGNHPWHISGYRGIGRDRDAAAESYEILLQCEFLLYRRDNETNKTMIRIK